MGVQVLFRRSLICLKSYQRVLQKIMAIGDGENDVEMLKLASLGVALGNGSEKAKAVADIIGATNDEDGVAMAIYSWEKTEPMSPLRVFPTGAHASHCDRVHSSSSLCARSSVPFELAVRGLQRQRNGERIEGERK
ncbi:hypothetical protein HPP92_005558 [Vanilla planifolia]|uniref:Uncharacterized protein n=1 Tax=Vanilla planifolia TaxID=51239 RepID=A0A835VCQ7_VANPL|nr:hypothetical protein HPP92_005558 [Vanilla planifolia]